MKAYDDQAADAYSRVVTHYSMAAHVEDARERLIALNRPVPEPTKEELADSEAEEQSRTGITFKDRALLLVKRGPVTVNAARIGEPTLTDPPPVTAPDVHKRDSALFTAALSNQPLPSLKPSAGAPPRPQWPMELERRPPHRLRLDPSVGERSGAPRIAAQPCGRGTGDWRQASSVRVRRAGQAPASLWPAHSGVPVGPAVTPKAQPRQQPQLEFRAHRTLADWRRSVRPTTNLCLP